MATPTICAIASGIGGGIGIIRLSGRDVTSIAQRILRPWPDNPESHKLYYGQVVWPSPDRSGGASTPTGAEAIDQVLFTLMRGPRSYTGEDVVEIHGHGGAVTLRRILEACLSAGAEAAAAAGAVFAATAGG